MVTVATADAEGVDALRARADEVADLVAAARDRAGWLAVVSSSQRLVNALAAVQEHAVAEVARREHVWDEDGTVGEVTHGPGRVALDAADLVAPALGCSHAQAQRRVEQAVRVAAARTPVEVDEHDERPVPTGLGGLHRAMSEGRLDTYRAGVVAHELEAAPADVAEAVVAALAPHLHEDGTRLRQRCRRILARVCPDLLRERAARARAATGLRRWASEPGVDTWYGTFPSEEAATAWVAVDRRAHELVAAGSCTSVEQARGAALMDLVLGRATVDVQVVLTVPAAPEGPAGPEVPGVVTVAEPTSVSTRSTPPALPTVGDRDLVRVQGARPAEPVYVGARWLRAQAAASSRTAPCDRGSGARLDVADALATDAYRPSARLVALVKARDGRCRFPGCTVAARFCDVDHVRAWPSGPTCAVNLVCLCRRHHRIKQSPGWWLRLAPDGIATWTDPCGVTRTTHPLNALEPSVLADVDPEPRPPAVAEPLPTWSALECRLDVHVSTVREWTRDGVHWSRVTGVRADPAFLRHGRGGVRGGRRTGRPCRDTTAVDPPPF